MAKKLFLNTLYSIAIVICLVVGYEDGLAKGQYVVVAGAAVIIAIFIALKVKLLKEIKAAQKP